MRIGLVTPSPTTPSSTAPAKAEPAGYTCEQLIPPSVRDKHLKDKKIEKGDQPGAHNTQCDIAHGGGMVLASCHATVAASKDQAIAKLKEMFKDAKDVTDIGKGGIVIEMGPVKQYTVWDDNSDCQLNVNVTVEGVDAQALTKDIVAAFPPK